MLAHPAYARRHATHTRRPGFHHPAPVQQYAGSGVGLAVAGVGLAALAALVVVPTFVVGPWIVKAFKPEWSYGRRLGASLAFGIVSGTVVSIARGLGGVKEDTHITLNAPGAGATSTPAATK